MKLPTAPTPKQNSAPNLTDQPSKQPIADNSGDETKSSKPDPTRFGDWEKNGRCIDF